MLDSRCRNHHTTTRNTPLKIVAAVLAPAILILATSAAPALALQPVVFDWAEITNTTPGVANQPDTVVMNDSTSAYGSVEHDYRIATTAVTNAQYVAFLNAVASQQDPHNLYHTSMSGPFGGITRSGNIGNYTYTPIQGRESHPVVYVSFLDAMRFVNWLANGQPSGPNAALATEAGAYVIIDGLTESRSPNAAFFLPSENEWYKAAYHQPQAQGGPASNYWFFPTGSNTAPIAPPSANATANYNNATGSTMPVNAYQPNFSGIFNAAGNVWEWNESLLANNSERGLRGGSFAGSASFLRSNWRSSNIPTIQTALIGFRVAAPITDAPLTCNCDRNGDGILTIEDYFEYLNEFFAQLDPDNPGPGSADFNGDNLVTEADFEAFRANCLEGIATLLPCP